MTTTDTPTDRTEYAPDTELTWTDTGFNHGEARERAMLVLDDIIEKLDDYVRIIGITINYKGTVDVHLDYDNAVTLVADLVRTRSVEYSSRAVGDAAHHHHWLFNLRGVPVDVVAVVKNINPVNRA